MKLTSLTARFGAPGALADFDTHQIGEAPAASSNAEAVLALLRTFGADPKSLEGMATALSSLEDDEDLAWWRVAEGLVVTSASDGWWVLFKGAQQ
jgi:hypothetical protein